MYYALVYYLKSYPQELVAFRQKYDPRTAITAPHLTFVFPVIANIHEATLIEHISQILAHCKPISITLRGITKAWDDYVFLMVADGTQQVIELHDQLYTGILATELRKDLPYVPHVTIGQVEVGATEPIEEAKALNLHIELNINKLHLIRCVNDSTPHEWEKIFELS